MVIVLCDRGWHMVIITPVVSDSRCDTALGEGGYYSNHVVNCSLSHVICHSAVGSCVDDDSTAQSHRTAI